MKFDLNVQLVQFHKVSVSEIDAMKLAFEWIYKLYDLPVDSYLKFGFVCIEGEHDLDVQVRPQTDKDVEAFEVINTLRMQRHQRNNKSQQ